jgi:hypothetical protein
VPEGKSFVYKSDMDANGIVYHIRNEIVVTSAGNAQGNAEDFLNRDPVRCWTANQKFSWYFYHSHFFLTLGFYWISEIRR